MTTEDVLNIYRKFHVPQHIRRHMVMVCAAATVIADEIAQKGREVDLHSLQFAALVHDALKISNVDSFEEIFFHQQITAEDLQVWSDLKVQYGSIPDSLAMYRLLAAQGEEKTALMVKKHDFASLTNSALQPFNLEEKLLYYADKRVKHDQVVNLRERLRDGRDRYTRTQQQLEKDLLIEKKIYQLEKELFKNLAISPEDLQERSCSEFLKLSEQYLG